MERDDVIQFKVLSQFAPRREAEKNNDKRHSPTLSSDRYSSHVPPKYTAKTLQPEPTGFVGSYVVCLFGQKWDRFENMAHCKELEVQDNTKSKLGEN